MLYIYTYIVICLVCIYFLIGALRDTPEYFTVYNGGDFYDDRNSDRPEESSTIRRLLLNRPIQEAPILLLPPGTLAILVRWSPHT